MHKLKYPSSEKRKKVSRRIVAAGIILCILVAGFSPFGQNTFAKIAKKFFFIPGLGKVVDDKGYDIFILPHPIKYSYPGNNITINSIIKDDSKMIINMYANNSLPLSKLRVEDEKGNSYTNSSAMISTGGNWSGSYTFLNIPEHISDFNIIISNKVKIPFVLKKAESYSDYQNMGPTDVKNNFGITLVPQNTGNKIDFYLIPHQTQDKQVYLYGKSDINSNDHFNILIKDDKGNLLPVDFSNKYSTETLSEFNFIPNKSSAKYTILIPEITLEYN